MRKSSRLRNVQQVRRFNRTYSLITDKSNMQVKSEVYTRVNNIVTCRKWQIETAKLTNCDILLQHVGITDILRV